MEKLFCINPIVLQYEKRYIEGTGQESLKLFCTLINLGIYIDGFIEEKEAGHKILNKPILCRKQIEADKAIILTCKKDSSEKETNICPDPVILNPDLDKEKIVIYGMGEVGNSIVESFLKDGIEIQYLIDSDESKVGQKINEMEIYGKEKLLEIPEDMCIIEASVMYREINENILQTGKNFRRFYHITTVEEKNSLFLDDSICVFGERRDIRFRLIECLTPQYIDMERRNIFILGSGKLKENFVRLLKLFDIQIQGRISDQAYFAQEQDESTISLEEILYENNYLIFVDINDWPFIGERLQKIGLQYYKDFMFIQKYEIDCDLINKKILDINLGFTYVGSGRYPGVFIIGDDSKKDYKIAVLGESNTDEILYPFSSWPKLLFERFRGRSVTIYNASVTTYNSTQELLKMLRDILVLRPDMILVYGGINDAVYNINKKFEFKYLKRVFEYANQTFDSEILGLRSLEIPGLKSMEKNVWGGIYDDRSNFEIWLSNIELMHVISNFYNIKFFSFLQPMLGSKRGKSFRETKFVENYDSVKIAAMENFRERMTEIKVKDNYGFLFDLSDIFDYRDDIYLDICHVFEEGNRIVADKIYEVIKDSVVSG